MHLPRRIVSEAFRNIIAEALPGLNRNPAYWRFLEYIFFGTWRDEDFNLLLVPQELLAEIEGRQAQVTARNYNGELFLNAFERDVELIAVLPANHYAEQCRLIGNVAFRPPVPQALDDELNRRWRAGKQVYFVDGSAVTPEKRQQQREDDQADAMQNIDGAACEEERILLEYMNHLPPHRFTKLLRHMDAAYEAAQAIEQELSRRHQLAVLRAIEAQPQPFYQPSTAPRKSVSSSSD